MSVIRHEDHIPIARNLADMWIELATVWAPTHSDVWLDARVRQVHRCYPMNNGMEWAHNREDYTFYVRLPLVLPIPGFR